MVRCVIMLAADIIEYYKYYLKNICILTKYYEVKFIRASDLIIPDPGWVESSWKIAADPVLNDATLNSIANSIIEHGTYWILVVDKDNNVLEGRHRVTSLQQDINTCDYELPCIIINDWDNRFNITLDTDRMYYNPISFIMDYTGIYDLPDLKCLQIADNPKIAKLYTNDYGKWLTEIILYANRLNRYIYQYTKQSGEEFFGAKYLNNAGIFKQMREDHIRHKYMGCFE